MLTAKACDSLSQLISITFAKPTHASDALRYRDALLAMMKDIAAAQRRSAYLALAVVAIFEVVRTTSVSGFTIGPIAITDVTTVQQALPAILAYLIYDLTDLGARYLQTRTVCSEIARLYEPQLKYTDLDRLLFPRGSSLFGAHWPLISSSRHRRIIWLCQRALQVGAMLTPLAMEAYAFYYLFTTYGFDDPLLWLSLLASIFFLIYAIVVFVPLMSATLTNWTASWRWS